MTCGAAVLLWIEPADTTSAISQASPVSHQQILHDTLETSTPLTADRWQAISVEPLRFPLGPVGRTLAARPESKSFHFLIDQRGRFQATPYWRSQQPVDGSPNTIRICLASQKLEDVPSEQQWRTLLLLCRP